MNEFSEQNILNPDLIRYQELQKQAFSLISARELYLERADRPSMQMFKKRELEVANSRQELLVSVFVELNTLRMKLEKKGITPKTLEELRPEQN